ncbi:MAG TPA: alpha/beta hydrolase [Jatrophihabitantaceae bacterium]|jgi:pimeloyl-ACP methyl ester carboxylesterase|nr:alpha/beta hydrolase [Jatrophihabitantaceae bacterium]
MSITAELGTEHDLTVGGGTIRYRECGTGAPVVFVHGLLVNGDIWRKVVPGVAKAGFRCITPDWPLGSHTLAMPEADLTPPGIAALIAQFLDALDLHDVTLVANDTGGAITQILITQHPSRVGRVVLTPSDCFERFFPPAFAMLPVAARVPGMTWSLVQTMRLRILQRLPIAFGWLAKRRLPNEIADSYLGPSRKSRAIRRDLTRFLRSVDKRHTLAAAALLPQFTKPVLLAWAAEDKVFPVSLAHRLAERLPDATIVEIEDSYTFVPEDQPDVLTAHILQFVRSNAAA